MSSILAGAKQYIIPVFQRFYSWTQPKWEGLWRDIVAISEDREARHAHFIGPFIVISRARPSDISPTFLVIDGQQRLITLTILLCALRDRARSVGHKALAKSIETNAITYVDAHGQRQMKIIPRSHDKDALEAVVFGRGKTLTTASPVGAAYHYFAGLLTNYGRGTGAATEHVRKLNLERLADIILYQLKLVMISLDDHDNPANVYESLNYKGVTLTDADLIRNYLFMQLPLDQQEHFDAESWRPFEKLFEVDGSTSAAILTNFFYRYLISVGRYFPRYTLYSRLMEHYETKKLHGAYPTLESFVAELQRYAVYYTRITRAQVAEPQLRAAFARIKLLDVDTTLPLLMQLYERYTQPHITKTLTLEHLLDMLRKVESFILRRSVMGLLSREYGQEFASAIKHATSPTQLAKFFNDQGWPGDEEVIDALVELPIYLQSNKRTRLILAEIERSLPHQERVDINNLTIEHIMPRALTPQWQHDLGADAARVHADLVHTLGNLTLTGDNNGLANHDFTTKKAILAESKLNLNRYFADCAMWTEADIRARSAVLARHFVEIWPRR
jgi:hypothetical protein